MIELNNIVMIEEPYRMMAFQSEEESTKFFVLPLEPEIAQERGKPSLQLTVIEKNQKISKAFLTMTITLPFHQDMRNAAISAIRKKTNLDMSVSVDVIRVDIKSCKAEVVFGDIGLSLMGTFEGVGEPRVLMSQSLSADIAKSVVQMWEKGLRDVVIKYDVDVLVPTRQAKYSEKDISEHLSANDYTLSSTVKTRADITKFSNNIMTFKMENPVRLSRQVLKNSLIETVL